MKMLAEYLEKAITLEKLASEENDPNLKADLEKLAADYRKLAERKAKEYKLDLPPQAK
jgi:hypothetical protein